MQYHEAKLLASAGAGQNWPESDLPEVVFAGRSNAGKSSLINALVNRKNLAYEGKTPGKTRLLNFFTVDGRLVLTDAPGYGYAKGGGDTARMFGELMEPYFRSRKNLKAMVLVLDIRRVPNADDQRMVAYARDAHLAVIAACTKSDKLGYGQQLKSVDTIARELGIRKDSCVICSAQKKTGMDPLWEKIDHILSQTGSEAGRT